MTANNDSTGEGNRQDKDVGSRAPDPFDPVNFALPQDFISQAGSKKLLLSIGRFRS